MTEIQSFNPRKIIRQIFLSLIISLGSIVGIFSLISFRGVKIDLTAFRPAWLFYGVIAIIIAWISDAIRLYVTTRAWRKPIPFRNAITGVLSCYFMSAITPSATGGSPAEMLIMNRSGFTWGEAGSLTAICGILYQVTLLILLFILVFLFQVSFALRGILLNLLYSFLIFYCSLMFLLFFFLYRIDQVYRLVNWGMGFTRRHFPKVKFSEEKVIEWIKEFFGDFKSGFRILCIEKPQYLLWNIAGYSMYFLCFFSVAFFSLRSLGVNLPLLKVISDQIPLHLAFGFLPTPGASGGVELSISSIFLQYTGPGKIGMFILFWRLITFFLSLVIGAITFFRVLYSISKLTSPEVKNSQIKNTIKVE